MLMSPDSLKSIWSRFRLNLLLPVLLVIGIGLLATSASRGAAAQHGPAHLRQAQAAPLRLHLPEAVSSSRRQPGHEPGHVPGHEPLFFLTPLLEDPDEDSALTLEGILALLGFSLFYWGRLMLDKLRPQALARLAEAASSPLAGLGPARVLILLQVFRL